MEKQTTCFLIFILIVISFISCEYEPTGIYNRDVNEDVVPPEIQAIQLDLDDDTVYIFNSSTLIFRFSSNNQEIIAVAFLIDNIEKKIVYSESGTFNFEYSDLTEGIHKLTIKVYTQSGTGSIADILGVENYVFEQSWVLVALWNYYNEAIVTTENGYLNLFWNKYPVNDIASYEIFKTESWNYQLIGQTTKPEFTDSTYVGEGGRYLIRVKKNDGSYFDWGFKELTREFFKIYFLANDNNQYFIEWDKTKYYNALNRYEVYQSNGYDYNYIEVMSTNNPNDTIFTVTDATFNERIEFIVKLVPNESNISYYEQNFNSFQSYSTFYAGFNFADYYSNISDLKGVGSGEFIFVENCSTLKRFSVTHKQVVQSMEYETPGCYGCTFSGVRASPAGSYITANNHCTRSVFLINTGNFNNYLLQNLTNYSGQQYAPEIPISDNSKVLVNSIEGGFYVYDFINNSALPYYNGLSGGYGLSISSNGDYIYLQDDSLRLVKVVGSSFEKIWAKVIFATQRLFEFHGTNPNQLVTWDGVNFSVKNCNDFSEVYHFTLNQPEIFSIDYHNNKILASNGTDKLYIYNLETGELMLEIPTILNGMWSGSVVLAGNAIITNNGVIFFIN